MAGIADNLTMDTAKSADFKLSRRLDLRAYKPTAEQRGNLPARCSCGGKYDFAEPPAILKCRACGGTVDE